MQRIYEEVTLAEIVQIIHRSSIRNMKEGSKVDVYMYHSRVEWQKLIQTFFTLPHANTSEYKLFNKSLYNFEQKCLSWAKHVRQQLDNNPYLFKNPTAFEIGGKEFKNFFNRSMGEENKQPVLLELFSEYGIKINQFSNGRRTFELHNATDSM